MFGVLDALALHSKIINYQVEHDGAPHLTGTTTRGMLTCPSLARPREREPSTNMPIQKIWNTPCTKRNPFSTAPRCSSLSNLTLEPRSLMIRSSVSKHCRHFCLVWLCMWSHIICISQIHSITPNQRHQSRHGCLQPTHWLPCDSP